MNEGNEEVSPVILCAVELMKKVIQGLEIELLGGMRRAATGKDKDGIKLSPLGVSTKMTYIGSEKNVFLTHQECEDMLGPWGDTLVNEFIMHIFKDELYIRDVEYVQKNLFEALKIPLDYLGSKDDNNKNDNK